MNIVHRNDQWSTLTNDYINDNNDSDFFEINKVYGDWWWNLYSQDVPAAFYKKTRNKKKHKWKENKNGWMTWEIKNEWYSVPRDRSTKTHGYETQWKWFLYGTGIRHILYLNELIDLFLIIKDSLIIIIVLLYQLFFKKCAFYWTAYAILMLAKSKILFQTYSLFV